MEQQIFFPPEAVRGIRQLTDKERELFRKEFDLPAVRIPQNYVKDIRQFSRFFHLTIDRISSKIKNIICDPQSFDKFLLFHPCRFDDVQKQWVIEELYDLFKEKFSIENFHLIVNYEDWHPKHCIKAVLPKELEFSGFSHIGHIIHVNLRENLLPYKNVIGQILLDKIASCRTVVNKLNIIENEYRCFEPDLLAGEANYETVVKENKITYKLDFSKVFWNSRLSTEHTRLVDKLDNTCVVYDCCAGIGPFVIPAVKKGVQRVLANDLNPICTKYLAENLSLNNLSSDSISIYNLDAVHFLKEIVASDIVNLIEMLDSSNDPTKSSLEEVYKQSIPTNAHIIMNLPSLSLSLLPHLRGLLYNRFSSDYKISPTFVIYFHCYIFVKSNTDVDEEWYIEEAKKLITKNLRESNIVEIHNVSKVAGRKMLYCISLQLLSELLFSSSTQSTDAISNTSEQILSSSKRKCTDGEVTALNQLEPLDKKAKAV